MVNSLLTFSAVSLALSATQGQDVLLSVSCLRGRLSKDNAVDLMVSLAARHTSSLFVLL